MPKNRLDLDFSLEYADDRVEFVKQYLNQEQFKQCPPTPKELETIGDYILWGKDRKTGLNAKQSHEVKLSSRHKDWDQDDKTESLDALMEAPTFSETQILAKGSVPTKVVRKNFAREEALANCPEDIRPIYVDLFRQIDELELKLNLYEIKHGKRTKPPRPKLLNKFTEEELAKYTEQICHWNQYYYLKQKHNLVDLRRQQYVIRDGYTVVNTMTVTPSVVETEDPDWDAGIEVLPLGVWIPGTKTDLVFRDWQKMVPVEYTEEDLKWISDLYWEKNQYAPTANQTWIDFRREDHIYQIFKVFFELEDAAEEADWKSNTQSLMRAFKFYVDSADLTDIQRDVLDMKIKKIKNIDIAIFVNKKYKKSYTPNYISTIFTQRIIPRIADAAKYHEKVVSNLFFPEEFKTCTCCGKTLLRDPINFTRKSRSRDGLSARCKTCEKEIRLGRK